MVRSLPRRPTTSEPTTARTRSKHKTPRTCRGVLRVDLNASRVRVPGLHPSSCPASLKPRWSVHVDSQHTLQEIPEGSPSNPILFKLALPIVETAHQRKFVPVPLKSQLFTNLLVIIEPLNGDEIASGTVEIRICDPRSCPGTRSRTSSAFHRKVRSSPAEIRHPSRSWRDWECRWLCCLENPKKCGRPRVQ